MGSISKKLFSIIKHGIDPIKEGMENLNLKVPEIEAEANRRAEICFGCEYYVNEPIDFFQVEDHRIPKLSKKMCDQCGCALPYLLRQNSKICKKWN